MYKRQNVKVVAKERPDIEKRKTQLLLRMAEDKKQLSDLEARILYLLSNSSGNILDDEASACMCFCKEGGRTIREPRG